MSVSTASNGAINIYLTGGALDRAEKMLAGIPGGAEKAVKSAMSRAVSSVRSNAVKEIRKEYDIGAAAVRSNQNIKSRYTYAGGNVTATVLFAGHKIPLYRYNGTNPKMPTVDKGKTVIAIINGKHVPVHPGVAASGHQKTDTSVTKFDNAFIARMKSGHIGIFERTGGQMAGGGDAIHELMGSSVPTMVGNETVREELTRAAWEKFDERLDHEIMALMNGWR